MLTGMSSRELLQWQAYEEVHGPLGTSYADETLATIQEQLQLMARLIGGQYKPNPAPKPKPWVRPFQWAAEMRKRAREEEP